MVPLCAKIKSECVVFDVAGLDFEGQSSGSWGDRAPPSHWCTMSVPPPAWGCDLFPPPPPPPGCFHAPCTPGSPIPTLTGRHGNTSPRPPPISRSPTQPTPFPKAAPWIRTPNSRWGSRSLRVNLEEPAVCNITRTQGLSNNSTPTPLTWVK